MSVAPDADFSLVFGRNEPEVHVCVGMHDTHVSRQQAHHAGALEMGAVQHPPARRATGSPRSRAELKAGHFPMFIVSPKQEHLLEVRISAPAPAAASKSDCEAPTDENAKRDLDDLQKLVLVCLAQRYLRGDPHPQPLPWAQGAEELQRLRPDEKWGVRRAAHIVDKLRKSSAPR
jgi:hypothetical protein